MVSNFYFDQFNHPGQQEMIESLVTESLNIYGHNLYYCPRTINNYDPVYHEDDAASYDSAYEIEMYIKNSTGFGGIGDILGSAGLDITDSMTLVVSRRTFQSDVLNFTDQLRPNEGDLIYLPLNKKIFKVNFVEHESIFYQMGALQVWELRCTLLDYSGEILNTGIEEIDKLDDGANTNVLDDGITLEDGGFLMLEDGLPLEMEDGVLFDPLSDFGEENDYYQREGLKIIDYSVRDPFTDVDKW